MRSTKTVLDFEKTSTTKVAGLGLGLEGVIEHITGA